MSYNLFKCAILFYYIFLLQSVYSCLKNLYFSFSTVFQSRNSSNFFIYIFIPLHFFPPTILPSYSKYSVPLSNIFIMLYLFELFRKQLTLSSVLIQKVLMPFILIMILWNIYYYSLLLMRKRTPFKANWDAQNH